MTIPPLKVVFSPADRSEILGRIDQCLATGQVAQGKNVSELERDFGQYNHSKFALAVNSGGGAIELVMRALGVQGKDVLLPTNTFLATAGGVHYAGGNVVLVDSAPDLPWPDLAHLKASVTDNTAGVVLVHIGGAITSEIEEICAWAASRGMWVFEDCAHAHGSELNRRRAGTFGVAGAFSFFSTKLITAGEGGMVVTDDERLARQVSLLRNYGKPDPWITYSTEMGANWRLNELAAAVVVVHLKRLDEFVESRNHIAQIYTERLGQLSDLKIVQPQGRCSWYKYIVLLPNGLDRTRYKERVKASGVSLAGGVYDLPLHKQPVLAHLDSGEFPNATDFCARHICLPLYSGMTDDEANYVVDTLLSCL